MSFAKRRCCAIFDTRKELLNKEIDVLMNVVFCSKNLCASSKWFSVRSGTNIKYVHMIFGSYPTLITLLLFKSATF